PEAIRAPGSVDARSDLSAIGVLGYFLLAGAHPFEGGSFIEICGHHLHTPPPRPSSATTLPIPEDIEAVVLSCLQKEPARRPPTAGALIDALDACRDAGAWSQKDSLSWWSQRAKTNGRSAADTPTVTVAPASAAPAGRRG
ncbi:MAG: serine/threonine-protein kinase, partial [Thermoanaerobaculia bacterium]